MSSGSQQTAVYRFIGLNQCQSMSLQCMLEFPSDCWNTLKWASEPGGEGGGLLWGEATSLPEVLNSIVLDWPARLLVCIQKVHILSRAA